MDLITTKPVLVTGANGFLGAHVVSQLLARGYSVRGIVRPRKEGASEDAPRPSAADFMSASSAPGSIKGSSNLYAPYSRISGAPEKLEFIEADLNSDDNWEAALSEVEYVIHTAGPVNLYSDNPQLDFMQPMVEGTRRLLELCQKSHAVKKFVYISCISTLCEDFDSIKDYNENDWNTTSTLTRYPAAFRYVFPIFLFVRPAHVLSPFLLVKLWLKS
jgi:nucleoside-diphosphate-sugar epimerase